MARFSPHSGEGAVSTGLMVVVQEAKSVGEARTIVELLEANQIVALVNLEVEGIIFPWKDSPKKGAARVLVPSSMLPQAREVLGRAHRTARGLSGARGLRTPSEKAPKAPPPPAPVAPSKLAAAPFGGDVVPRAPPQFWGEKEPESLAPEAPSEDDDDEGPIDLELPEPSSLTKRILVSMMAIAFGTALQRILDLFAGPGGAIARFGARSPVADELWRLVTAGFIHSGPEHFFSNAAFGILLGVVLFGTHEIGATALVWLLSSMVGLATESSLSAALVVGASAGNYGLVGLWANGQFDRARHSLLPRRQMIQTIGLLLLLVPGALTPITSTGTRIAVLAHAAGFLSGFLLGFVFKRRLLPEGFESISRRSRLAMMIASAIVVTGLTLAGLTL